MPLLVPEPAVTGRGLEAAEFGASLSMSACSASRCELTEMYSPTAIDSAPATRPASPAVTSVERELLAAATPMTSPATDKMPSFAPSTAARSHPARSSPSSSMAWPR